MSELMNTGEENTEHRPDFSRALCEEDTLFRTELEVSKEDGAVSLKGHGTCPFRKALMRKVLGVL